MSNKLSMKNKLSLGVFSGTIIPVDSSIEEAFLALESDNIGIKSSIATRASIASLLSTASASVGSGMIGHSQNNNYPAGTIGDHLENFVLVTDHPYLAKGDNIADDTGAIQAACDAVAAKGGGMVMLPRGTYKLTSEIHITNHRVILVGSGIDLTVLRQSNATANGINFDYPVSFGLPTGGGLRDLTVEAGAGFTSGSFWGDGSSGVGIKVSNASDNFCAERFSVTNFAKGAQLLHCWNTRWLHYRIAFFANCGMEINRNTNGIGGSNSIGFAKVSNNGYAGTGQADGLRILSSGGEFFSVIDHTSMARGIVVAPTVGNQVSYLFFDRVTADTCTDAGWDIDGTVGTVASCRMVGSWAGYNYGKGVYIHGPMVDSIRWTAGASRENSQEGFRIEGGVKNVDINGAEIASNSRGNPQVYPGVYIGTDQSSWKIKNCRIGNFASSSSDQGDSIYVAAGTISDFEITGNDLTGWGSGKQAMTMLATYTRVSITANIPDLALKTITYYFSENGTGNGLTSSTPTSITDAYNMYLRSAVAQKNSYKLQEVGPGGTYTFASPFISLGNTHVGSPLTLSMLSSSVIQGVNSGGVRTNQFANIVDSANLTIEQNGCMIRTFEAVVRSSRSGWCNMTNSKVRDCTRVLSAGYGGRFNSTTILDWDGRDMAGVVISGGQAITMVIGTTCHFDQGSFSTDPNIHHFARGAVFSEGSSGHLDYLTFADCSVGVELGRGCGAPNMIPMRFKRCTTAILSGITSLLISPTDWNNSFAIGLSDECGTPVLMHTGGGIIGATTESGYDNRPYWVGNTLQMQSAITGDTTERVVWTPLYVLPKGARAGDHIKIEDEYQFTGNLTNGVCTVRIKAGSVALATIDIPSGTSAAVMRATVFWTDPYTVSGHLEINCASPTDKTVTPLLDRINITGAGLNAFAGTSPVPIVITMQLSNGSDTFRKINSTLHQTLAGTRTINA